MRWIDRKRSPKLRDIALRRLLRIRVGDEDAVKAVLRTMARDYGYLLNDESSELAKVLLRHKGGWWVHAVDRCEFPDVNGCRAVAYAPSKGDDPFLVFVTYSLAFRNDRSAEPELDDVEDAFDDLVPREVDVEAVVAHGEFIDLTLSLDEDDYDFLPYQYRFQLILRYFLTVHNAICHFEPPTRICHFERSETESRNLHGIT